MLPIQLTFKMMPTSHAAIQVQTLEILHAELDGKIQLN
jgi:hypothetical protein